mgnify:CR=1 FL=1|tara:strand:+ start:1798 stop:2310 length:513 start_codon:yes stop_codon:yes gene_type:complete
MNDLQPNQFRDTEKNVWSVSVTVGNYMRIKSELGIDIVDISGDNGGWLTKSIAEENLYEMLSVLAMLIEKQLDAKGMTIENWYDLMDGDCLEAAGYALLGGVINFIPAHKRGPLLKISSLVRAKQQKASELMTNQIEKMEGELDKILENQMESEMTALKDSYSSQQESLD